MFHGMLQQQEEQTPVNRDRQPAPAFVELNLSRARRRTTPMIETTAKQQLLNDIEKLDQHSDHALINILRCCIDPRRQIAVKPAVHQNKD